jgi:hypothetical protein
MGVQPRIGRVQPKTDHVNLPFAPLTGQLNAGDEADLAGCAGGARGLAACDRVVIGQRQQLDAALRRERCERRRREQAVGAVAVGVQIDAFEHALRFR